MEKDGDPVVGALPASSLDDKEGQGFSFYTVRASRRQGRQPNSRIPTPPMKLRLANNVRMAAVDRGKGPYKVLYVGVIG